MRNKSNKREKNRTKLGHVNSLVTKVLAFALLFSVSSRIYSLSKVSFESPLTIHSLKIAHKVPAPAPKRAPASFVHDDEFEPVIFDNEIWIEENMVEDRAGVFNHMKNTIREWSDREEFAERWSLENTGLYVLPSQGEKETFLKKYILKYLDKRVAGEIKRAEDGSTLKRIGEVQKALKPSTKVSVAENFKVHFKARVLEGKVIAQVENPFVDYSTELKINGQVNVYLKKDLKALGVQTSVRYEVNDGVWVAAIDKKLTPEISARVSSSQNVHQDAFTKEADQKIEFMYNLPF